MDRNELYKIIFLSMFAYFLYELIEIRSYLNYITLELNGIHSTLGDINSNLEGINKAIIKNVAYFLQEIRDALVEIDSELGFLFKAILNI